VIIAVNQLETHVLQPLVMGRAVSIHPLAVVLGIAAGGITAGIVGALLAVPTIAFIDRAVRALIKPDSSDEEEGVDREDTAQTEERRTPILHAEPDVAPDSEPESQPAPD
jgi:predicted PurR-regulated permease PerM